MSDYTDYENNLAFPPEGDWAETKPVQNTDRTESTIELIEKIERLTSENVKIKELMRMIAPYLEALTEKRFKLEYIPKVAELLTQIKELDK